MTHKYNNQYINIVIINILILYILIFNNKFIINNIIFFINIF